MNAMVTRERMNQRDHYRFQVNARDKRVVAFCYNAMAEYFSREATEQTRNRLARLIEDEVRHQFRLACEEPAFRSFLQYKFLQNIEPELQRDAKAFWHEVQRAK